MTMENDPELSTATIDVYSLQGKLIQQIHEIVSIKSKLLIKRLECEDKIEKHFSTILKLTLDNLMDIYEMKTHSLDVLLVQAKGKLTTVEESMRGKNTKDSILKIKANIDADLPWHYLCLDHVIDTNDSLSLGYVKTSACAPKDVSYEVFILSSDIYLGANIKILISTKYCYDPLLSRSLTCVITTPSLEEKLLLKKDLNNGTYEVHYDISEVGEHIISVKVYGLHCLDSPSVFMAKGSNNLSHTIQSMTENFPSNKKKYVSFEESECSVEDPTGKPNKESEVMKFLVSETESIAGREAVPINISSWQQLSTVNQPDDHVSEWTPSLNEKGNGNSNTHLPAMSFRRKTFNGFESTSVTTASNCDEITNSSGLTTNLTISNAGDELSDNKIENVEVKAGWFWKNKGTAGKLMMMSGTSLNMKFPIGIAYNDCARSSYPPCYIVGDTFNDEIKFLSAKGDLLHRFGKKGTGPPQFKKPSAIVVFEDGVFAIKDNFSIQTFTPEGIHIRTFGKNIFTKPYGLAIDGYGRLVTLNLAVTSTLCFFSKEGELISQNVFDPLIPHPTYSKCRFLAANKSVVAVVDLGLNKIYVTNFEGKELFTFGSHGPAPGQFNEPSGIAIDSNDKFIIADSKNNRIQVFSSKGKYLDEIKLSHPIRRPSGIHLTNTGLLLILNYLNFQLLVFQLE